VLDMQTRTELIIKIPYAGNMWNPEITKERPIDGAK
jgi:hypothetical protein